MLNSLISDLSEIAGIELIITRDSRLPFKRPELNSAYVFQIDNNSEINKVLRQAIKHVDAVWIIAPETDRILADLCTLVANENKPLLTSSSVVVQLAGNKFATLELLKELSIPVVSTSLVTDDLLEKRGSWVIKPYDGVGCEGCYLINGIKSLRRIKIAREDLSNYIIQPYIQGISLSLSCLFKAGMGVIICCNQQLIEIEDHQFHLSACKVNVNQIKRDRFEDLVTAIALALPDLWGYVGIDLMVTPDAVLVLEINPRLTTSYAGIKQATGINVAEHVLQLLRTDINPINPIKNHQVTISIARGNI